MKFLISDCIIIRYNHNHITKLVTFPRRGWGGSSCPCLFDFKIFFAIIIIISDEIFQLSMSSSLFSSFQLNTKCESSFSQIHVRLAYLFLYLRSRYICYRKRDRMLTHSHSATSLYNSAKFKPISDQFTSIVYAVPASNLRTGGVWPRVILCHFHILASKIS
jgi:hypothetical protein